MSPGRTRGRRVVVVFIVLAAVLTFLLPTGTLARTNSRDKITVFLHGINGRNCTQDWRDQMLDMRSAGFTGAFYVVKFLSSDVPCDLSGIPNASNVSLFDFGTHSSVYGHEGTSHDNNTDIRHLSWHLAHWLRDSIPDDPPVDLVAHSMGGLIVRFALAKQSNGDWPALDLEDVVTLGTPHGGVNFAAWTGTLQGRQMEPGSFLIGWLAEHAANPQGVAGTEWTVMGSDGDFVVRPGTATKMEVSQRIRFGALPWPIGHGGYMHVTGSRTSKVWTSSGYVSRYTYGPLPRTRASLQYAGW